MSLNFRYALNNMAATRCLLKEIKASNVHAEGGGGFICFFVCVKKKTTKKPLTTPSLTVKVCA